jgi:hypothetical protein
MECPRHPGCEARYRCEKYEVMMCERCMTCRSPKVHCKYRQQCLIWELLKEEIEKEEAEKKR